MLRSVWLKSVLAALAIAAGMALSLQAGLPETLPAASLGWELLLHVERSLALLGLVGAGVLVGVRALGGRLPIKLGQLEYGSEESGGRLDESVEDLDRLLRRFEESRGSEKGDGPRSDRVADML